jgi:ankyrin repeat protein
MARNVNKATGSTSRKKAPKTKLSALFKALARDPVAVSQSLLADKELPTRTDETGRSLLHHVAASGNMPCFDLLMAEGADMNAKDAEANTPLHLASYFGNIDVSKKLIAMGCNTQVRNARKLTAMEMAGGRSKDVLQLVHHADYRAVSQLIDDDIFPYIPNMEVDI